MDSYEINRDTVALIPKDENDDKNIIMEIRGAAGGDEANIFAGDLFRMYSRYADKLGWKYEILDAEPGTAGGYSQIEVKIKGEKYFICGNSFKDISEYRVYGKDVMTNLIFDYPDGGFRGWGSIIPVKMGTRTRYFHITFDRHGGSSYTWSYGNIYVFEMM